MYFLIFLQKSSLSSLRNVSLSSVVAQRRRKRKLRTLRKLNRIFQQSAKPLTTRKKLRLIHWCRWWRRRRRRRTRRRRWCWRWWCSGRRVDSWWGWEGGGVWTHNSRWSHLPVRIVRRKSNSNEYIRFTIIYYGKSAFQSVKYAP